MKKILIFTCIGGHTLTSNALQMNLSDEYIIVTSDILETLPFDHTLRVMTKNSVCAESIYRFFYRHSWLYIISKFIRIFYWYLAKKRDAIARYIEQHIANHKPDMIISVIPFFNEHLLRCAEKYNIPFILAPTDFEISHFLYGICKPDYQKFHMCLAFDSSLIQKTIHQHGPLPHVHMTGPILRPDFFITKNRTFLRQKWHVRPDVPIILLMMGSEGVSDIVPCMNHLLKLAIPVHIFCLLGKHKELRATVENLVLPPYITCTVLEFVNDVADLMSMADIFIAKPGGMSTFETIVSGLPMLVYHVGKLPFWEEPNAQFIYDNKLGFLLYRLADLEYAAEKMLEQKNHATYKMAFEKISCHNGAAELKALIKSVI